MRLVGACLLSAVLALPAGAAFGQANQGQQGLPGSGNAGYPPGAIPLIGDCTGANTGGVSCPLGGTFSDATRFYYLCSYEVNGLGATAATTVTITAGNFGNFNSLGTDGQSWTIPYTYPAGATIVSTPIFRSFSPCLKGPKGGPINVTVPGAAGNTSTNILLNGYAE